MLPEPTTLAYLAGMIDADGYISVDRSTHKGRIYRGSTVGIAGTDRQPHDLAAGIFGGNVRCYLPRGDRSHHKPQFQWQRYGRSALPVIEAVLPFLRVKRDRALLALELEDMLAESRWPADDDPFPWAPANWSPDQSLDALAADIRALQGRSGPHRTLDVAS